MSVPDRKRSPIGQNNKNQKESVGLTLDEAALPRTRTRSAMAMEMGDEGEEKNEFNLASYFKRGFALVFDTTFFYLLLIFIKWSAPIFRQIIQFFLDKYNLEFLIPEALVLKIIMGLLGILAVLFLIIIPVSFFNTSFGKKIFNLKIRGRERYTISLSLAVKRELILKPLSIIILAGFITPFFSKNRLSIHDMIAETIVIEE
jgi:uncharacterized RDD family membrane protein YckC